MPIEPYLNFDGRCEEAIEFYKKALGAECTMLMRFNQSPEPCPPGQMAPGYETKIMHASLNIGGATVMASDCYCKGNPQFQGVTLSLSVKDEAAATKAFNALADGGQIHMPLGKTFFSKIFGMVADKFGVPWMVIVPQPM
jgi:PhnB protein